MSPHGLLTSYESNEIAVFLIILKEEESGNKKRERMIMVISSSNTMTVTQRELQPARIKPSRAVGVTFLHMS